MDEFTEHRVKRQRECAEMPGGHPRWEPNDDGSQSCVRCGLTVISSEVNDGS